MLSGYKRPFVLCGSALALLGCAVCVACVLAFWAGRAGAVVPESDGLTYSALLTDATGHPIDGMRSVSLTLWDAQGGGKQRCAAGPESRTLTAGRFQLQLPAACASAVHERADLWLEVSVDGASLGRSKLGSVPYALESAHSQSADQASGALATRLMDIEQTRVQSAGSPTKPLKLCRGTTPVAGTDWKVVNGSQLRVTVDMSSCGFSAHPVILSSVSGNARHMRLLGGGNTAPPSGGKSEAEAFDVTVSDPSNLSLDPVSANADGWHIAWAAVGD
jgi:hypothetical protein